MASAGNILGALNSTGSSTGFNPLTTLEDNFSKEITALTNPSQAPGMAAASATQAAGGLLPTWLTDPARFAALIIGVLLIGGGVLLFVIQHAVGIITEQLGFGLQSVVHVEADQQFLPVQHAVGV